MDSSRTPAPLPAEAPAAVADRWIDTPCGKLFARIWGATPGDWARTPIVLLHESLGCVGVWRTFPARLAAASGRPVVAYDRLGFGRSDPFPGSLPPDFIRREADEGFAYLRATLGLERFIVLGHSVGGGMAVGIAAAYGDACRALITEAAQSCVEPVTRAGVAAAKVLFSQDMHMARIARFHGDKAAFALSAWVDSWLSPAFDHWSLDADLPSVACPVLVMHGADDEYATSAQPERIVKGVSGPARLALLPGCGHVPHLQEEALVIATVTAFLNDLALD